MKSKLILVFALALSFALQNCKKDENSIFIPANSKNALAQAIADSKEGGKIILASGEHTEDNRVLIDKMVKIEGQPGAILRSNTTPLTDTNDIELRVALHIFNASGASVDGIEIQSTNPIGGAAILVELSDDVMIKNCKIVRHQHSILVEMANNIIIEDNEMTGALDAYLTGDILETHGIVIVNGKWATILNNKIDNAFFGAWVCDEGGLFEGNTTSNNMFGLIGCVVPKKAVGSLPRNPVPYTDLHARKWTIQKNNSFGNAFSGYALADGSQKNILKNNKASGNGIDYELFDDNVFFGFPMPRCQQNVIEIGPNQNITILDCGFINEIIEEPGFSATYISSDNCK